jgi:multiple sugar transport system ATP-binding protein
VAALYVTHDQTEAMTLGNRVAVLRAGVLQQCDAPQVLYDHPNNIFVAGFIGSPAMNLLEAKVAPDASSLSLGTQKVSLPEVVHLRHPDLTRYRDRRIVVGIRPEALPAASDGRLGEVLIGEVELVEALGSELLIHFRTDAPVVNAEDREQTGGTPVKAGKASAPLGCIARVDPRQSAHPGDRFRFSVSPDQLEFFDIETGLAI